MNRTTEGNPAEGLPEPCTARSELPDLGAVRALGLNAMTVEEARLCAVIWSWLLADGKAKTRSPLYQCMYCLGFAAKLAVRRDGVTEEAPHPGLYGIAWPQADSVFRRLGIDHLDLAAYWRAAKNESDDACYPLEWLTAFFPLAIWPMLLTLIKWGPERAAVQFEQVAIVMGQTPIQKGMRRRPAGSLIARSSIDTRLTSVWRLMRQFVKVRTRVKASPRPTLSVDLLESWTQTPQKPNLVECGTLPSGMDNSGPSLAECQRALHELARDFQQHPTYPLMRLRRLVLLSLLPLLGPRADALRTAMTADYDPQRLWPDGVRRPTLTIRPGKTREWHEQHYLPLPADVVGWLEQWLKLTDTKYMQQPRPLFPGRPMKGKPLAPLSQSAFYAAVAGHSSKYSQRALVPLGDDEHVGVRPHGFRKVASELAHQGAIALKKKYPGAYDHLTPEHFSRALLGHTLVQSTSDVYRSLDAQKLTSAVVEEAWRILWGHDGGDDGDGAPSVEKPSQAAVLGEAQINALALDLLRIVPGGDNQQVVQALSQHRAVLQTLAASAAGA